MPTIQGQASAAATSVAIPAHAVGDLIIVSARGTAAAPSVPGAGGTVPAWVTLQSALANSVGLTTVAFVATATTTTTGVFTNATHICVLVLRPAASKKLQTAAARSSTGNANNTQTIVYPALTLNNGGGASTSFGVRIGTRGVADSEVGTNIPAGWTNQTIQPAGASALMAVHTRAALAANPTADSIATTGTNSAYRAHTVEVEELPLTTDMPAVVAATAAVSVGLSVTRNVAATVTRTGAVAADMVKPITFEALVVANVPYAGEWLSGEFLVGQEPIVTVDMTVVRMVDLSASIAATGVVTAQADKTLSLAATVAATGVVTAQANRTASLSVSVAATGAVAAQQAVTRTLAATVARTGVVVAQEDPARGLASSITGVSALAADVVRTRNLDAVVAGATVVSPSLTVTNASFVALDAVVAGTPAVTVALGKTVSFGCSVAASAAVAVTSNPIRNLAATVAGTSAVVAQANETRSLGASVTGTPALTVAAVVTRGLAVTISRTGVVSADVTVTPFAGTIVSFGCVIANIEVLCGEKLCGTFLCGGSVGPRSVVTASMARTTVWAAGVDGNAQIQAQANKTVGMEASVAAQANVVGLIGLPRYLSVQIGSQAVVSVTKLNFVYIFPTTPVAVDLVPTTEASVLLVPTTETDLPLVPTVTGVATLVPATETDVLLVPTIEEGV